MKDRKWFGIRINLKRAWLLLFIATLATPFAMPGKSSAITISQEYYDWYVTHQYNYTIHYSANGATSGEAPADTAVVLDFFGDKAETAAGQGTLAKAGYTFAGWNTRQDGTGTGYLPGTVLNDENVGKDIGGLTGTINFYVQWVPVDSGLSPILVSFDLYAAATAHADVTTVLTRGDTVTGIDNGGASLNPGDYSRSGNTVTIKKEYLERLPVGTTVLTFRFGGGSTATLVVGIIDSTPAKDILSAAFSEEEVPNQSPQTPFATGQAEVYFFVPYGTDRTSLTPILTLSPNALVESPAGAQDFSQGSVTYRIKSSIDGTTKDWKLTVIEEAKAVVSPGAFVESAANDGTISGAVTVTLANDTFYGDIGTDYVANGKAVVTNVPAGLTASVTKASDSTAEIRLNGSAVSHEAANSLSNLHVKFQETYEDPLLDFFWIYSLTNREFDLSVRFVDEWKYAVSYNGNGSTGGSVPTDPGAYKSGDRATVYGNVGSLTRTGFSFKGWNTASNGKGTGYAAGDTFVMGMANVTLYAQWELDTDILQGALDPVEVPSQSGREPYTTPNAELFFYVPYGTDVTHLNPVLTLSPNGAVDSPIGPQDFSRGPVVYTIKSKVDGTVKQWELGVREEPKAFYSPGGFKESASNDGTIDGAVTVALANDIFNDNIGTDYIANGKMAVTNVPAGLTASAVKTSDDTVTIRLIGTAVSHGTADSLTNLHVKFQEANENYLLGTYRVYQLTNREYDLSVHFIDVLKYAVSYDGNGNTGGSVPADHATYAAGDKVTVSGNTGGLIRTDYTFTGWNTAPNGSGTGFAASAAFGMGTSNVTLYAQWSPNVVNNAGGAPAEPGKLISLDGNLWLPAGREGEVSLGGGFKIGIPSNAADGELKLTINRILDAQGLLSTNEELLTPVYEVLKNFSGNFSHPVTLTFAFDPAKLKDGQRAEIFYYDERGKTWVKIGGTVNGSQISAEVDHFTKFAVLAVGAPPAPAIKLSDIAGHWAESDISQAISDGWVRGYADGTFKPNRTMTRAEFAVMLANALKLTGEPTAAFADDAKIPAWARSGVARAAHAGLVHGDGMGAFRPAAFMTRAEMAVILANALGLNSASADSAGFADDAAIPAWAKGAASAARKLGLVSGKGANAFDPNGLMTRAEAVKALSSLLAKKE